MSQFEKFFLSPVKKAFTPKGQKPVRDLEKLGLIRRNSPSGTDPRQLLPISGDNETQAPRLGHPADQNSTAEN